MPRGGYIPLTPRDAPSIRLPPRKSKPFSLRLPLFATFFAFLADYACILKKNALNSPRTLPPSTAQRPLGRCQSGRMSTIGNRVYVKSVPRVRIPPCPLRETEGPHGINPVGPLLLRDLACAAWQSLVYCRCTLSVHKNGSPGTQSLPRQPLQEPAKEFGFQYRKMRWRGRAVEGAFSFSVGNVRCVRERCHLNQPFHQCSI